MVGTKEAADAVAQRKLEQYREKKPNNETQGQAPAQRGAAPGFVSPKKFISITMPSDASEVGHAWGDLTPEIVEVIKGPCLGIKLEGKEMYVVPADKIVTLEA